MSSFNDLRPYFDEQLAKVDPDFREWEDAFNIENIPSNILDKAWHLEFQPFIFETGKVQNCFKFSCPVKLTVIFKGYKNPKEAVDSATNYAQAIVKECCKHSNRLNQPYIKNVLPNVIDIRALVQSNDNAVALELTFDCLVHLDIE